MSWKMIEEQGHTRGNRSMTRSSRQRVNRNARRLVEFVMGDSVRRRRVVSLAEWGGLDAATLREWVGRRLWMVEQGGVVSVVGAGLSMSAAEVEVNWEYAAEMVNRKVSSERA